MKYLYMLGYGRSGSTLVESRIASLVSSIAVGEIKYLIERGLLLQEKCSCGDVAYECVFWSKVYETLKSNQDIDFTNNPSLRELTGLVDKYESTVLFVKNALATGSQIHKYVASQKAIVEAVESALENTVMIDSSKMPARLYWLKKRLGVDPVVIFVVRDPRAVAWSCGRVVARKEASEATPEELKTMPRFGYFSSIFRWAINSCLSLLILRLTKANYILIRYEDFVVEQEKESERIRKLLLEQWGIEGGGDFSNIHSISGNPRRMTGGLTKMVLDEEWKEGLSAWKKRLAYVLVFPLMIKFGYKL